MNNDGGEVFSDNKKIIVKKANEVILYFSAATSFKNYNDISGDAKQKAQKPFDNLKENDYTSILNRHIDDYQYFF